jgi:hypothetical protein
LFGRIEPVSLHAGVAARVDERKKLERLCRYVSRPAVAEKRLSLTPNGSVRYALKTRYCDGTTRVIFEPLDFIARRAALAPTAGQSDTFPRCVCAERQAPRAGDAGQAGQRR